MANKLQTNLRPGVFLDISKAFDKVWHPGLIYKFRSFGMKVLLQRLESFLSHRYQSVLLNEQKSDRLAIKAGLPKGSVLVPLLLIPY